MAYHPDYVGYHLEIWGARGWPDEENDPWEGIPEEDRTEEEDD